MMHTSITWFLSEFLISSLLSKFNALCLKSALQTLWLADLRIIVCETVVPVKLTYRKWSTSRGFVWDLLNSALFISRRSSHYRQVCKYFKLPSLNPQKRDISLWWVFECWSFDFLSETYCSCPVGESRKKMISNRRMLSRGWRNAQCSQKTGLKIQPGVLIRATDLCRKKQWFCTIGKPSGKQPATYAEWAVTKIPGPLTWLKAESLFSTNCLNVCFHTQEK